MKAVAALWEQPETEVEAVHLAIALAYHGLLRQPSRTETSDMTPRKTSITFIRTVADSRTVSLPSNGISALSLSTIIWRYVRQFVKMDAKEALQYVYCICLSADQGNGVGKEQIENAWELVRRIIVLANPGTAWEELVGGFRADGTRFVSLYTPWPNYTLTSVQSGIIEQGAMLLKLNSTQDYHTEILVRAAKHSEQNDRIPEAIKLYNLAGDYGTVISCLASALGTTISRPAPDEKSKVIEKTAVDILRHYERTNRAVGRDKEAVTKLLRIREAMNAKEAGRPEVTLEVRPRFASYALVLNPRRSWNPRTSSHWMGICPVLPARRRNSRNTTTLYKGICKHISR